MDLNDRVWNPWHGCHKCSEGCQNCYAYFLDKRYGRDTSVVVRNKSNFNFPTRKDREGNYKLESGQFVRVCMSSDFFIEEADDWRDEAWDCIRKRPDVMFSLLTKRAHRMMDCLPADWDAGWENVSVSVSCENQKRLDERMPYLLEIPSKHKWVSLKPFIDEIDLDKYLATGQIETVLAGGENYQGSRPLHYDWVKKVHDQCKKYHVRFIFGQTGNIFIRDGKESRIYNRTAQMEEALKTGLHYPPVNIQKELQLIQERKEMKAANKSRRNGDKSGD